MKEKLEKYGTVAIYKESETSINIFITGIDLDKNVNQILALIATYKGEKFPLIEHLINTDTYFLIILIP